MNIRVNEFVCAMGGVETGGTAFNYLHMGDHWMGRDPYHGLCGEDAGQGRYVPHLFQDLPGALRLGGVDGAYGSFGWCRGSER